MWSFLAKPGIGLEVSSRAARIGVVRRNGAATAVLASGSQKLGTGLLEENYASPGIRDREGLSAALRPLLQEAVSAGGSRLSMSLPDSLFRVQLFDFDDLPARHGDRERLVRWRFEKSAAFDTADTVLRYQVLPRIGKGVSVLSCIAKRDVVASYEDLLAGLGQEVWNIGISSLHALNFYRDVLAAPAAGPSALVWVTEGSYATIIADRGVPRFYRFREIRSGTAGDAAARITRELEDTIHFYTHRDPEQSPEISRFCLAGDSPVLAPLAEGLRGTTTVAVDLLTASAVTGAGGEGADAFAAAFGAGGTW